MVGVNKDEENLRWALQGGEGEYIYENIHSDTVNNPVCGRTPLHHLADYGHIDLALYVIKLGANLNAVDKHGMTPLVCAVFENHPEIVRVLLSHGADATVKTPDGKTLLESTENEEIKKMLSA